MHEVPAYLDPSFDLGQLSPAGLTDESDGHGQALDQRLADVDSSFTAAIANGLAHLTAEDEELNGRVVTLLGREHVNFGSCVLPRPRDQY